MAAKVICRSLGLFFIVWLSFFLLNSVWLLVIFLLSSVISLSIHKLQNLNLLLSALAMTLVVILQLVHNQIWLEHQWPLLSLVLVLSLGQAVVMITNHYVYRTE